MSRTVKIGVFGTWRGGAYIDALRYVEGALVTALCDKNPARIEKPKKFCQDDVAVFDNFDDFINSGLFEAVFICNYFSEHAEYAIRAMEKGYHVFSETMAASTMGGCVDLVRAVERTGKIYMLAENYPLYRGTQEMKRQFEGGTLGKPIFCEGEYVHPDSPSASWKYRDPAVHGEFHWRRYLPVTYYCSHALAPIMYITGARPLSVVGMAAAESPELVEEYKRNHGDAAGVMLLKMSDGSVARINGSSYMAPHANWYRISCNRGGIETMRNDQHMVRRVYNPWTVPEGAQTEEIYKAEWDCDAEKADKCQHNGSDYFVVKKFVEAVREGSSDYMDVYTATTIASVSILGWRSVINNSKTFKIPDFRRESDRRKWENDRLTPFPTDDTPNTLPYTANKRQERKKK